MQRFEPSRAQQRQRFTADVRIELSENDLDEHDAAILRMDERIGRIYGVLLTLLVSVSTACVLLVLNLTVGR